MGLIKIKTRTTAVDLVIILYLFNRNRLVWKAELQCVRVCCTFSVLWCVKIIHFVPVGVNETGNQLITVQTVWLQLPLSQGMSGKSTPSDAAHERHQHPVKHLSAGIKHHYLGSISTGQGRFDVFEPPVYTEMFQK